MSVLEPNSRHLRKVLTACFHFKKTAAETHRLLSETYGKATLSERTCLEWFKCFKSGDFDVEDRNGSQWLVIRTTWTKLYKKIFIFVI